MKDHATTERRAWLASLKRPSIKTVIRRFLWHRLIDLLLVAVIIAVIAFFDIWSLA